MILFFNRRFISFVFKEHEILNAWLTDLGFEEYYDLFVQSGYDMHTITRMTPEVMQYNRNKYGSSFID